MKTTYRVNDGTIAVKPHEAAFIEAGADRIIAAYNAAAPQVRAYGLTWYTGQYAALAQKVARETGVTFEQAAAFIAVCSPQTPWSAQVEHTAAAVRHLLNGGSVETAPPCSLYRANIEKGRRVVIEGDFSAVAGPKVGMFYRNCIGDHSVVTVDVWAIRVVVGRNAKIDPWTKGRKHALICAAYHLAAGRLGLPVAHVQAVAWVVERDGGKGRHKAKAKAA